MAGKANRKVTGKRLRGTGISVNRDPEKNCCYFTTEDVIQDGTARIYTNWNLTHMRRSREKHPQQVYEFHGYGLSEVFRADDDPTDWGQTLCITITWFSVDSAGNVEREEILTMDSNLRFYPYQNGDHLGFGKGINRVIKKVLEEIE